MPKLIEQDIEFYPDTNIPIHGRTILTLKRLLFYNESSQPYYHLVFQSLIGLIASSILFVAIFKLLELFDMNLLLSVWSLLLITPIISVFILLGIYFISKTPARKLQPFISVPLIIIIVSQAHFLYKPLEQQHYYQIMLHNQNFHVTCDMIDEYITISGTDQKTLQYFYTINLHNQTQNSFDDVYAVLQIARGTTLVDVGEFGIFEVSTDFPARNDYPISTLPPGLLSKSGMLTISSSDVASARTDLAQLYKISKQKVNKTIHPVIHIKAGSDIEKDINCTSTLDWYWNLQSLDQRLTSY